MGRPKKYKVDLTKRVDIQFIEDLYDDDENHDDKACISCIHRHAIPRSPKEWYVTDNYCDIDNHYIGFYAALWETTCKHHELEKPLEEREYE